MDPFNTAPDFILDLIFLKLNEEDLHETLRVSKSWFWASIRRIKKLRIDSRYNPLISMAKFYTNHRPPKDAKDWRDLFKHLVLNELDVRDNVDAIDYLLNNGCNTAELTIETTHDTVVTIASLKKFTRLQSFEYGTYGGGDWHPFIGECFRSSNSGFDPHIECPIEAIKLTAKLDLALTSSGWNIKHTVLHSVTKLRLNTVDIDFLRTLVALCPNLEELHCTWGEITQDWHQVFPANVKRIEFHYFDVDDEVATVINASTDSARHLLPYLCQNWESVDQFHFHGNINFIGAIVYEAFPQQREEIFVCSKFNEGMNFSSQHFGSRKIRVGCDGRNVLELTIPPSKTVKFKLHVERDFEFSPRDVCLEPAKVESLALSLTYTKGLTPEPFKPNSFEGFSGLTSLTLHGVSAASIKIALDQCPSITKLKLKYMKTGTIGNLPSESSYANVCELVLKECEEPIDKVFKIFPCLSKFKRSGVFRKQDMRKKKTDWLCQHLIEENKKYGVVFASKEEIRFMVSDDLQASLNEAQKSLNECIKCKCFLKGFKLISRFSKQKVIYIN